ILGGRDENLPITLFDDDTQGRATAQSLKTSIYAGEPYLVLDVATYTGIANSEIEDLVPPELIARELDRWKRTAVPFQAALQKGKPIVPQIETWAQKHGVELAKPGWKVELAKRVKQRLLAEGAASVPTEYIERWEKLFTAFQTV